MLVDGGNTVELFSEDDEAVEGCTYALERLTSLLDPECAVDCELEDGTIVDNGVLVEQIERLLTDVGHTGFVVDR